MMTGAVLKIVLAGTSCRRQGLIPAVGQSAIQLFVLGSALASKGGHALRPYLFEKDEKCPFMVECDLLVHQTHH